MKTLKNISIIIIVIGMLFSCKKKNEDPTPVLTNPQITTVNKPVQNTSIMADTIIAPSPYLGNYKNVWQVEYKGKIVKSTTTIILFTSTEVDVYQYSIDSNNISTKEVRKYGIKTTSDNSKFILERYDANHNLIDSCYAIFTKEVLDYYGIACRGTTDALALSPKFTIWTGICDGQPFKKVLSQVCDPSEINNTSLYTSAPWKDGIVFPN